MEDPHAESRAELARLQAKLATVTDPDLVSVLKHRIGQIEAELPPLPDAPAEASAQDAPEPEAVPDVPTKTSTIAERDQAERFIREARLERSRGNSQAAAAKLDQAKALAPDSALVLTAVADELLERRQTKAAMELYAQAMKLEPGNVALERKHAELVLRSLGMGSVEDMLRTGLNEAPTSGVNPKAATLLSVLLPGLGQLALGLTTKGAIYLGLWVVMLIWAILVPMGLGELPKFIMGGRNQLNTTVLIPLAVMGIVHISSILGCATLASHDGPRARAPRPRPPVDMPFE